MDFKISLIFVFMIICTVMCDVSVPTDGGTEIDSRFGLSDVKEFVGTAKDKIVQGAHKVGDEAEKAYTYVKDGVLTGYDYLKRKVKPNKDGLDHNIDIRTDGMNFPRNKRNIDEHEIREN